MPIKIWEHKDDLLSNSIAVRGSGRGSIEGEGQRGKAEALDAEIDAMLDRAVSLVSEAEADPAHVFLARRWAMGRATYDSKLLDSPHLEPDEHDDLWLAIDRKCRHGIRADGSKEEEWPNLVPQRQQDANRPDRDPFAVSLWLQDQDLEGTIAAFGGKYGNAQKLFMRPALRSLNLREALAAWMLRQPEKVRTELANNKRYWEVIKALSARFPARGPGSAKRPVHYTPEALFPEVCKVLDPLVADAAPRHPSPRPQSGCRNVGLAAWRQER